MDDCVKRYKQRRDERLKARTECFHSDYGVKGMKWGEHKAGEESESSGSKGTSSKPIDVSKYNFKDYRNPDGSDMPGYRTYREAAKSLSDETEKIGERVRKSYSGGTSPAKQATTAYGNLRKHSAVRDLESPSSEDGFKECLGDIRKRQNAIIEELKQYDKWNGKEWVKSGEKEKEASERKVNVGKSVFDDGKKADVSSFKTMSNEERNKVLDDAPKGSEIKGFIIKDGPYKGSEVKVLKESGYSMPYATLGGTMSKRRETYWTVDGAKDSFFKATLREVLEGKNKYYEMKK